MTMTMYTPVILNLLTALGLGVKIGLERQWRQRAAGLRTNALVSLGSAAFVALATLVEVENSLTAHTEVGLPCRIFTLYSELQFP